MEKDLSEDTKESTIARRKRRIFDMNHNTFLRYTYNITLKEYKKMLASQHNSCAVCGNSDAGNIRSKYNIFSVDHDHFTGQVRGLLCQSCNMIVIPTVEHYDSRIEAAKIYLKKSYLKAS